MSKSFSIEIDFSYGWCLLFMAQGDNSVRIKNHWSNDAFVDLVHSIRLLLEGKNSISSRWQHEISGGNFIDIVSTPRSSLDIAVHRFYYGIESESVETIWSATRGELEFQAHVPTREFVGEFASALRRVRSFSTNPTGEINQWKHIFPIYEHEKIENKASSIGATIKSYNEFH
ncbi:hypothetical protein [Actinopolyspora erythraea]|uniref:hypothetical protein n=1 Tax=Actinopolyspora erythraea TaxID=414996 RepID=UPI00118630FE|nr:hypothetical protein [Actinopolyspora erythraea]